jgi:hypothetical protein
MLLHLILILNYPVIQHDNLSGLCRILEQTGIRHKKTRVTEGYSILQPRVAVSLPGTNRSRYAKLFGNEPGIDPYTRAISDVYQDLFGEGSLLAKEYMMLIHLNKRLRIGFRKTEF